MAGRPERPPEPDVVWLSAPGGHAASGTGDEVLSTGAATVSRPRTGRRRLVAGAAVLGASALVATAVVGQGGSGSGPSAPTSSVAARSGPESGPTAGHFPVAVGPGQIVDQVATNAGVYTLRADPPQLSLQDAPDPPRPGPAPADGSALVVDREEGLIWVLATGVDSGAAWAYDSRTLEWRISVPIPSRVTGAAALGGQLWVASDAGVYLTSAPRPDVDTPVRVPGSLSGTYGIAADPTRGRVVAVTGGWPGQVYAIGAHDLVVRRLAQVPTGKSSIAVVDGHVWVGGYGYGRRLIPIGVPSRVPLPVEYRVGAGATVWPGRHVLWVTYGTGAGLSCLDPRTGAELASWPELIAPVTSRDGLVYAAAATDVTIQVLPKTCPG